MFKFFPFTRKDLSIEKEIKEGGQAKEDLKPGQVNWKDLKIEKEIKKGGQTTVYFATFKDQNVVVKKFKVEKECLDEYEILKNCNHENIIKTFGYTDFKNEFYLILERADTDLTTLISGKSLLMEEKLKYLNQIAEGLKYLHEGFWKNGINYSTIHRDLNPNNILV
jgi:serine/threonine protein kinase